MKALLVKFNSETDQEVLYEETVMCPETALIVMKDRHKNSLGDLHSKKLNTKKKKLLKFLSVVKLGSLFIDYKDFEDTVCSVESIYNVKNENVEEYYLLCTYESIKDRVIELCNLLKQYKKHERFFKNAYLISYNINIKETHEMFVYLRFISEYKDILNLNRLEDIIIDEFTVNDRYYDKSEDVLSNKVLNKLFNHNILMSYRINN